MSCTCPSCISCMECAGRAHIITESMYFPQIFLFYVIPMDIHSRYFNVTYLNIGMNSFKVSSLKSVQFLIRPKALPSSLWYMSAALTLSMWNWLWNPTNLMAIGISNLLFPLHCIWVQDSDKHFLNYFLIVVVKETSFILSGRPLLSFKIPITLYHYQKMYSIKVVNQVISS